MKKRIFSAVVLFVLVIASIIYSRVPDTFILYKDRRWENGNLSKLVVDNSYMETLSGGGIVPRKEGDYSAALSLFGIPYKTVTVKVLEDVTVIPGGQTVGIRMYSKGLIVVAVGRVNAGEKSPADKAGLKIGDIILKINGEDVGNAEEFAKKIAASSDSVAIEIKRDETMVNFTIEPVVSEVDNVKRIGVWVRDSTAGIGTLTYMRSDNLSYGALGHAISDSDTGVKFEVSKGSIENCGISGIDKGEKGAPGELKGVFYSDSTVMGNIVKNSEEGIFGSLSEYPSGERVSLGLKNEIKKGRAYIRTSLDGSTVEEYEVEILKVFSGNRTPTKGLVIEVTDKKLLEKTGGIVQGMSGSPILQDGKLIGAVTHVLVNDPTRGYGIFIENMIEAAG